MEIAGFDKQDVGLGYIRNKKEGVQGMTKPISISRHHWMTAFLIVAALGTTAAVLVSDAQGAKKKGLYKACENVTVNQEAGLPQSGFIGVLVKGSHIDISRFTKDGKFGYGYAFGAIMQNGWVNVSALCSNKVKALKPTSTETLLAPSTVPIDIPGELTKGQTIPGNIHLIKTAWEPKPNSQQRVKLNCPKGSKNGGIMPTPLPSKTQGTNVIIDGKYGKRSLIVRLIAAKSKTDVDIYSVCVFPT